MIKRNNSSKGSGKQKQRDGIIIMFEMELPFCTEPNSYLIRRQRYWGAEEAREQFLAVHYTLISRIAVEI